MSAGIPLGFTSQADYDTWLADMAAAKTKLKGVAERAEVQQASLLLKGVPLPEEVRTALQVARRAASFVPYLPMPDDARSVVEPVAEVLEMLAKALGL